MGENGLKIRQLRTQAGISAQRLADRMGVKVSYLKKVETDPMRDCGPVYLDKAVKAIEEIKSGAHHVLPKRAPWVLYIEQEMSRHGRSVEDVAKVTGVDSIVIREIIEGRRCPGVGIIARISVSIGIWAFAPWHMLNPCARINIIRSLMGVSADDIAVMLKITSGSVRKRMSSCDMSNHQITCICVHLDVPLEHVFRGEMPELHKYTELEYVEDAEDD